MNKCTKMYHSQVVESLRKPGLEAEGLMEDMQHVYRTMQTLQFEDSSEDENNGFAHDPAKAGTEVKHQ